MYPYFIVQGHKIYAVWIGIVISAFVFVWIARYFAKKYKLQFSKLFFWLPTLLIASYLLWNWAWLALDNGIWFPLRSFATLGAWLSPYWYHFHFVWLILWAAFAWRKFFKHIFMKTEEYKWVDLFFFSFAASLVPLGLFLLLWDTFVGKTTDAWYGVVALLNDSEWINFGRVVPLGIIVSIVWFLSYIGIWLAQRFVKTPKIWWYLWFACIFFALHIIFLGQHYPRHWVLQIASYTLDIKNYIALALAVYFLMQFLRSPKKR